MIILKYFLLVIAIWYSFTAVGKLVRGEAIDYQHLIAAVGIAGYLLMCQLGY